MYNRKFNNLVLTLSMVPFLSLLTACDGGQSVVEEAPLLRPVKTIEIEEASSGPYREFTAVVDASQKVDLAFKVSGMVNQLPVKAGDEVTEGQLIAKLDDTDFKVQLNEAQSSYDKASSDFKRATDLIKTNSISQADFDQLKAQHNSASAQLENAKNRLEYTELRATYDGIIAQRYTENFQEVSALSPIVALHDIVNINFKVDVPESVLINVHPDSKPPEVTASFASIPDRNFDLTFKEISTQADNVTKTYQVVFSMPNPKDYTILPGMSARVRVYRDETEAALAEYFVPAQAVLKDSAGNYVYTVTANGDGTGTVSRNNVTIGDITAWGIEIYSGLQPGQHVITAGMSKVSDGLQVKFQG